MAEAPGRTIAAAAQIDERLAAQLRFLLEIDRLKTVLRRSRLIGGSRRENSAEHSWHLALLAIVLADHADRDVDVARVTQMVLVHDIVEVDAGDVHVYDSDGRQTKRTRELAAAERIFALLPADQAVALRDLWDEYERRDTPEARFAAAVDRLQPLLLNHANDGGSWRELGVTVDQITGVNRVIAEGSASLWALAQALISDVQSRGLVAEAPPPAGEAP